MNDMERLAKAVSDIDKAERDASQRAQLKIILEDTVKKLTSHTITDHCCHTCDYFTDEHGDHGEVTGHACKLVAPIMWMKTTPNAKCSQWRHTPESHKGR